MIQLTATIEEMPDGSVKITHKGDGPNCTEQEVHVAEALRVHVSCFTPPDYHLGKSHLPPGVVVRVSDVAGNN